jgi:hypothetical protein
MIFMRLLQTGDNFIAVIMFVGIYSAFHFATLEEYYFQWGLRWISSHNRP